MAKVARILFPDGRLCVVSKITAYCEEVVTIAGRTRRIMEQARNYGDEPTAIVFSEEREAVFGCEETVVGNLAPALCHDIMQVIVKKGYYDFSDTVGIKEIVCLDEVTNSSLPYYCRNTFGLLAQRGCGSPIDLFTPVNDNQISAQNMDCDDLDCDDEDDDSDWGDYDE